MTALLPDGDLPGCAADRCGVEMVSSPAIPLRTASAQLDVVSDVICPWCYVGKQRLRRALALLGVEVDITVRWRPFELNPSMPAGGLERDVYYERKFGSEAQARSRYARVIEAAASEGLTLSYDRIGRIPNTRLAHRLIWLAGTRDAQSAVVDALFSAYFVEGLDLGDLGLLTDIAVSVGFAREAALAALRGTAGAAEVAADEAATRALGIDGVPAFLLNGRFVLSGAQSPETIALALTAALRRHA